MNTDTFDLVDFMTIKDNVKRYALSEYAKDEINRRLPSTQLEIVEKRLDETNEAKALLERHLVMPFMGLSNIKRLTNNIEKGYVLEASELVEYSDFLRSIRLIKQFLNKHVFFAPTLASYASSLSDFSHIEQLVDEKIANRRVRDEASKELKQTRQRLSQTEADIDKKLQKVLKQGKYQAFIQDPIVVQKQGYYTIPIKHSYKNKVKGQIIEESSKGLTVYIEPGEIQGLSQEREMLKAMEIAEVYHVLSLISGEIANEMDSILRMLEVIVEFDVIFARAKYAREIEGVRVNVNKEEYINLLHAKHPLLGTTAVPLTIALGKDYRALVITGANAGGKTVVLKTVALLTLMTMYGLLIPSDEDSHVAIFDNIFASIGDNQSLENSLSTFSSHLQQLAFILEKSDRHTLIVADEIGSGTDPKQGAGLAIALLQELYLKGAVMLVSTHYGELKEYAQKHPDFTPAAMLFDTETLHPTYQLKIGESGDSHAFWLADKMGIPSSIIQNAQTYIDTNTYPLESREFHHKQPKVVNHISKTYRKGDRVWVSNLKKEGIIYEVDQQKSLSKVFIDSKMVDVPLKRLKLLISRDELYPEGYNLDLLFVVDYAQYKLEKDLLRGSKKAWKKAKKK